jgi:hypothetical protein
MWHVGSDFCMWLWLVLVQQKPASNNIENRKTSKLSLSSTQRPTKEQHAPFF